MSYTIMIVDDSSVTRMVLKKTIAMVELPVWQILEADNGEQALRLLQEHHVDLILADLNMPGLSGLEMTTKILQDQVTGSIPIVVISAEANPARIAELRHKGIRHYIHKPFTAETVRDVLQEVLDFSAV